MKQIQFVAVTVFALVLFVGAANAQKKPKKPIVKKPAEPQKLVPPLDVRAAREKVDIQLTNVNRFIDVLGPIAQAIETLDASNAVKKLPPETVEKNEANKAKVIEAIRNLRVGLSLLESEFRTKTVLAKYLPAIEGITDLAAQSEDSAIAGKFVAAKEPLREVAKKLTDTLAAMPR